MCGRFTLSSTPEALAAEFDLAAAPVLPPRYNIAPGQEVAIVRQPGDGGDGADRLLELRRWGLLPAWSREPATAQRPINARGETAAERPAFREAWRRRRCLVPADGFYEWGGPARARQAYHIAFPGRALFGMAGLWESWSGPAGERVESCAIVTVAADSRVGAVHPRMPLILPPEHYAAWLDPGLRDPERLEPLLRPRAGALSLTPVRSRVGDVRVDDPTLIEPFEEQPSLL